MFIDRRYLGALILLMDQLLCTLQSQFPLLAVLGLIDIDEFTKESSLSTILGNQPGTLLIGLLKAKTIMLVISRQALIAPGRNLIHGNDTRLVQRTTCIYLHLLVVLPVQCNLAES